MKSKRFQKTVIKKRMKNTKGQFFIIFAVLIGFLVLGITTFYNYIFIPDFNSQRFYQACDSYDYEIHKISEMYSQNLISNNEKQAIIDFTETFLEHQKQNGNNISFWGKYSINGNSDEITDFTQGENMAKPINLDDHDFYYIMQLKKGEEIFNCESK